MLKLRRIGLKTLPTMVLAAFGLLALSSCKKHAIGPESTCVRFELLGGTAHQPSNVLVFFKLQTCDGDPVSPLRNEDLVIREDESALPPADSGQTLLSPTMGYDRFAVVLFDMSGSVADAGGLPHLQEAARWFMDRATGLQRVAFCTFDGRPDIEELVPFTSDTGLLRAGIDSLSGYVPVDRSRNLNGAAVSGLALLDAEAAVSEAPVAVGTMVLFTEGNDQAGWTTDQEAESAVAYSEHTVYAIGLGDDVDPVRLAALGKDGTRTAVVPEGLIGAFDGVAELMDLETRKYFVLAYCTMKRAGLHTVTLELAGKEGSLEFDFSADGFSAGCSTSAMADGCAGRECGTVEGGLWCGGCAAGLVCSPNGTCIPSICGNGDLESGEACDDGNTLAGDGCSPDCLSDETCGNGYLDVALGEACDDGNNIDGDGCQSNCALPSCGDGTLDPGEVCDDGNNADGDGCNAQCTSDETCGNSIVDLAAGEVCDDGNTASGDGCSANCLSDETCGNGVVDSATGEQCDDGNNQSGDGCSADCTSNETCGNSIVDVVAGEVCDDGNNQSGDGCSADCLSDETCGNGYEDVGEECDDGNNTSGDGCSADCVQEFVCGDAVCDSANYETCQLCPQDCCPHCGNGLAEVQYSEQCDTNDLNGRTCLDFCYTGGTLACTAWCEFDVSGCTGPGPVCGNNLIECQEQCDGTDLGGKSCVTLGYSSGQLACDAFCKFDLSGCTGFLWYLSEDFEGATVADWTFNGQWQVGTPTQPTEPAAAHGGSQCAGTVIGGNYSNNNTYNGCTLVSPPVDLSTATAPELTFYHYVDTESCCDGGNVWVTTDGGTNWSLQDNSVVEPDYDGIVGGQWAYRGNQSALGWQQVTVDLSAHAGQTIQIRFSFRSDSSVTFAGWYIDDVVVTEQ